MAPSQNDGHNPCHVNATMPACENRRSDLRLAELEEHGVYSVEGSIDLLSDLCASKDDLARYENEQHDFWFDHAVDETREEL